MNIEEPIFHIARVVVWKSVKYGFPDREKPLLCITNNGKLQTFAGIKNNSEWYWKIDKYNLEYWCYQSELKVHD